MSFNSQIETSTNGKTQSPDIHACLAKYVKSATDLSNSYANLNAEQKLGVTHSLVGLLFLALGIAFMFQSMLLSIGNGFIIYGIIEVVGVEEFLNFLKPTNPQGSNYSVYGLGFSLLLIMQGWGLLGFLFELYSIYMIMKGRCDTNELQLLLNVASGFLSQRLTYLPVVSSLWLSAISSFSNSMTVQQTTPAHTVEPANTFSVLSEEVSCKSEVSQDECSDISNIENNRLQTDPTISPVTRAINDVCKNTALPHCTKDISQQKKGNSDLNIEFAERIDYQFTTKEITNPEIQQSSSNTESIENGSLHLNNESQREDNSESKDFHNTSTSDAAGTSHTSEIKTDKSFYESTKAGVQIFPVKNQERSDDNQSDTSEEKQTEVTAEVHKTLAQIDDISKDELSTVYKKDIDNQQSNVNGESNNKVKDAQQACTTIGALLEQMKMELDMKLLKESNVKLAIDERSINKNGSLKDQCD